MLHTATDASEAPLHLQRHRANQGANFFAAHSLSVFGRRLHVKTITQMRAEEKLVYSNDYLTPYDLIRLQAQRRRRAG